MGGRFERVKEGGEFEHRRAAAAAYGGGVDTVPSRFAGLYDLRDQPFHVLADGAAREDRFEQRVVYDIGVAGAAERVREPGKTRLPGGDGIRRQDGGEQRERAAQAAQCDTGLMQELAAVAVRQMSLVVLPHRQRVETDRPQRVDRTHSVSDRGCSGPARFRHLFLEERVAALRFGDVLGHQRQVLRERDRKREEIGRLAGLQLEFQFA